MARRTQRAVLAAIALLALARCGSGADDVVAKAAPDTSARYCATVGGTPLAPNDGDRSADLAPVFSIGLKTATPPHAALHARVFSAQVTPSDVGPQLIVASASIAWEALSEFVGSAQAPSTLCLASAAVPQMVQTPGRLRRDRAVSLTLRGAIPYAGPQLPGISPFPQQPQSAGVVWVPYVTHRLVELHLGSDYYQCPGWLLDGQFSGCAELSVDHRLVVRFLAP